jgi:hydroxymethylpyrimidine/phosphomethylpyrimidine kinase
VTSVKGRVLIVAGSDCGGGAGIQADIKTVTALNGYAATAITALTAQNTQGVFGVHPVPPEFIAQQMELVLQDIGADVVKTGMLHSEAVINAVADTLEKLAPDVPLVVDPVMVAKGGASLLDPAASAALRRRLLVRATVLTPNIPEAEVLSGLKIVTTADMRRAADILRTFGAEIVLLKGGHLESNIVTDVLVTDDGVEEFSGRRIETSSTHGTGCTMASAIATRLAQGYGIKQAVAEARMYVRRAIETAPGYGHGHGPLNHAHPLDG